MVSMEGRWHGRVQKHSPLIANLRADSRSPRTADDEEFISTGTIVVSNGLLHEQILRVLREGDAAPLPQ